MARNERTVSGNYDEANFQLAISRVSVRLIRLELRLLTHSRSVTQLRAVLVFLFQKNVDHLTLSTEETPFSRDLIRLIGNIVLSFFFIPLRSSAINLEKLNALANALIGE